MSDTRKGVDAQAGGIMLLLCIIWGIQQVAIKGVAAEISPVLQIAIRSGLSAVLVWILMQIKRQSLRDARPFIRPGIMVGILFALEFLFVAEGLHYTSASHMAVFLYTAPAFAAMGLQLFNPDERLALPQWGGILLAFAGITVAFLSGHAGGANSLKNMLIGDAMGLMAGISWGATTVVVRCSSLKNAPTTYTLLYQLAGACLLLSAFSLISGQHHFAPQSLGIVSLVFQILVVGFASFLIWFSLMKTYLASQLGVLSFMTPVFGVLAGVLILHEKVQPGFVWGTLLIIAGIIIVSGYSWIKAKYAASL